MTSSVLSLSPPARDLVTAAGGLYESPRWLAIEEHVADHPPLYVTGTGRWASFAAAYRFDVDSNPWPAARLDLFLRRLGLTRTDEPDVLPCYLLGGRRPGHSRVLSSAPPGERADEITRLVAAAADQAAERGAATLAALYCDAADADLATAFRACGGIALPSLANHVLTLPGHSIDDWLAALPHKRRTSERADMRKLSEGSIRFRVRPLTDSDLGWVVALEIGLYHKYGANYRVTEARRLHEAYLHHLNGDAHLAVAALADRPVGFCSIIRHRDTAYVRQGGFDHDACAGLPVYFGTVFHATISWAYREGVRHIDYSTSADVPKRHRGCLARSRTAWAIPLVAASRAALLRCAREASLGPEADARPPARSRTAAVHGFAAAPGTPANVFASEGPTPVGMAP
jgi:hypothetical protein